MKYVTWYLVVAMFIIGIVPKANAGFSPSEVIALSQFDRADDFQKIQRVLEMKIIGQRLHEFGFTQDDIQARLSRLSDAELHKFAQKLDDLNVGGDGLGVVIALLVIAILVVILLELTGHKVVMKKK